MKQSVKYRWIYLILLLPTLSILGGCSGYARPTDSASGVQVYGTVDVGVQHDSR